MTEASAPELFSASRRKFGEVLLACDKPLPNRIDASLMLAIRLPGLMYYQQSQEPLEISPARISAHSPLFTHAEA